MAMTPEQKHTEVMEALDKMGYKKWIQKSFHLEDVDEIRAKIMVGNVYRGMYDFVKHCLVD